MARGWRKVHLGIDADTQEIWTIAITGGRIGDAPVRSDLLFELKPLNLVQLHRRLRLYSHTHTTAKDRVQMFRGRTKARADRAHGVRRNHFSCRQITDEIQGPAEDSIAALA
jgi:hypothetical protein